MFNWVKKIFIKSVPVATVQIKEVTKLLEKPCKTCGMPIFYDPSWKYIPKYCRECQLEYQDERDILRNVRRKSKQKYQDEHDIPRIMRRKCKRCGKQFTFSSNIKQYPIYCKDCRAKVKVKKA